MYDLCTFLCVCYFLMKSLKNLGVLLKRQHEKIIDGRPLPFPDSLILDLAFHFIHHQQRFPKRG